MGSPRDAGDAQERVEQCLERVEPTASAQREALQEALQLTAAALGEPQQSPEADAAPASPSGSATAGPDAERRRWFRAARLRLLQHLERLDTALALNNGCAGVGCCSCRLGCPSWA